MKVSQLAALVGGLSTPSKMPGFAYGIPAQACKLGAILRKKKGSVCFSCYAFKGMYVFPVVKRAQARRLELLSSDLFAWKRAMVSLLEKKYARKVGDERVFRWHDAGDLQSVSHLQAIVEIANLLPSIKFWLPTRELQMVREYLSSGKTFPANLIVRISATMVGQKNGPLPAGTVGSTVGAGEGFSCPARTQENSCKDCRACWSREVPSVDYHKH
jgi:hypothetical protein